MKSFFFSIVTSYLLIITNSLIAVEIKPLEGVLIAQEGDFGLKLLVESEDATQQGIIEGHKTFCTKLVPVCLTAVVGVVLVGVVFVSALHIYPDLI